MRLLLSAVFLSLVLVSAGYAQETPVPTPASVATVTTPIPAVVSALSRLEAIGGKEFSSDHLSGRWAIGVGCYNGQSSVGVRKRTSDKTSLDLIVSGYHRGNRYWDFSGNSVSGVEEGFSASFGWRRDLKRVLKVSSLQWCAVVSGGYGHTVGSSWTFNDYADSGKTYGVNKVVNQERNVSFFTGPGFEIFLPYWKNFSLEGTIGLMVTKRWVSSSTTFNRDLPHAVLNADQELKYQDVFVGTQSNNFSVLSGAVHYYF
jgi:hypothetical protein